MCRKSNRALRNWTVANVMPSMMKSVIRGSFICVGVFAYMYFAK